MDHGELIRAAALQGFAEAAREVGLKVPAALRAAGLAPDVLTDPEGFVPYGAFARLLEACAEEAGCADFGLRLAQHQNAYLEGPLTLVMRHAQTLSQALALGAQYGYVFSPAMRASLVPVSSDPSLVDVVVNTSAGRDISVVQSTEFVVLGIVQVLRWLSDGSVRPELVLLPHRAASVGATYHHYMGCGVQFGATFVAVRLQRSDLSMPMPQHNPLLLQMAQSYIEQRYGAAMQSVVEQVRRLLRQRLALGRVQQVSVAATLAMHPKTLQRRLAAEGVRFDELADRVRRERFVELLQQPTTPSFTEMAYMLGYAEPSVLARSCQRWFGCSPRSMRQRAREGHLRKVLGGEGENTTAP
ncbi:AraC family transcriptional regulator ligand-binding domain-containing protein [Curvibacter sp. APW13]|uniref:AraC family transcriptional regulator n=1 Tax=Curvibacter sp. APW13 TaxID=3077236 RepID=UPI0028E04A78|nr:AraC family transcriptional regulator ligand-binding domain-containing protein [Curvibacter sp. APW13]MDT8989619.1 AraC family transcriptional regulator ligand-binding domain-containing protein [Curvibacter sp. APW13]